MNEQTKDVMHTAIEAAFHNQNLAMEDLVKIMHMARQVYEIDGIVIHTNRTYKYQLDHIVTCNEAGTKFFEDKEVAVTKEQYHELVNDYINKPVGDKPLAPFEGAGGSVLHAGLLRSGEYFGTVAFWNREKRNWNDDVRKTIEELAHLMFLFISMNNMVQGMNAYKMAKQTQENENVLSGFFLSLKSGRFHAMKLIPFMRERVSEWSDYDEMVDLYVKEYIDPIYGKQLKEKFSLGMLQNTLSPRQKVMQLEYPRVLNGSVRWIVFRIELLNYDENRKPLSAFVSFYDNTETAQNQALLSGMSNVNSQTYNLIAAVDLDTEKYGIYMDNREFDFETTQYEPFGNYEDLFDNIVAKNMELQYMDEYKKMFSVDNFRRHFDEVETPIQYEFSSDIEGKPIWVSLEAIRSHSYQDNDRKILLYCRNITEQKTKELQMKARNKELVAENREKQYLLEHDLLTGAWNREGYQRILEQYKNEDSAVAYIQIDIDNFKVLNDTYGHDFGDEVLKQVTLQLQETFRAEDYVFRFGGDEFAVLLTGCKNDIWENIADKQRMLHIRTNQILKKNVYITLSMGISWSKSGFYSEMITLADAALYKTKMNGRSGLCVFDREHHTVFEWHDEIGINVDNTLDSRSQSITGECRIEFENNDWKHGRLICNEPARVLMGFAEDDTPEDCFALWLKRVDPFSQETLNQTHLVMMDRGQAECTYIYQHPTRGKINVRSGGRCLKNDTGIVFYCYHQSLQDTNIVLGQDDSQNLINAMTGLYFASYYVSLVDDWFCIFKSTAESRHLDKQDVPASVAIKNFVATLVQPEYRDEMYEFVDLETLPARLQDQAFVEAEYLSMVEDKGWCRMRLLAVRRDESGVVTHFQVLVASIDKQKKAQMEHEKEIQEALELQLHVGELLTKTEVRNVGLLDRQSGEMQFLEAGMVKREGMVVPFDQMKAWGMEHVCASDRALFEQLFDLDYIESRIADNGTCILAFREAVGINSDGIETLTPAHIGEDAELCMGEGNVEIKTVVHHYEIYDRNPSKLLVVIEDVTDSALEGIGRIQEFGILDYLEESIAIFDYETYDIVYLNKAARNMIARSPEEYRHRKCYDIFCERTEPCEFCDRIILDNGEHGYMFRTIESTGVRAIMHGCAIEVNGRKYRLEQAMSSDRLSKILPD